MDLGTVVAIVVAVILGIISIVLTIKLIRNKKPTWAYQTSKIIGLGTNAPPELKLSFAGKAVKAVFKSTVIFFNKGKDTIRKSDITKDVLIKFEGAEILRDPIIKRISRDANEFQATKIHGTNDNSIKLDFLYLDKDDGAVLEILHTECKEIELLGNIIGVNSIKYTGRFEENPMPILGGKRFVSGILLIFVVAVLTSYIAYTQGIIGSLLMLIALVTSAFCGLVIGYLLVIMPNYLTSKKFPRWSKDKFTSKSFVITNRGTTLQAYCMKCRTQKIFKNPKFVVMKNGREAVQGICPDCGTKMFRIGFSESTFIGNDF
jgi:hypothetical protein